MVEVISNEDAKILEAKDDKKTDKKQISIKNKKIKISPSILSVPLEKVPEKLKLVSDNIDYIHIDVMDGKFVTNKTDGVGMFDVAKLASDKPLDVHLMVENPIQEIEKYKGSEIITIHIEALQSKEELEIAIKKIKQLGAKVGISIKPNTTVSVLTELLGKVDLILVMTVEPGYGGQKLIRETLWKVSELRKMGYNGLIEVDGGVNIENAVEVKNYDVDIIVAGTAIFSSENENEAILKIKE